MVCLKWFLNLGENTNRELRIRTIYEWQQVIYGDRGFNDEGEGIRILSHCLENTSVNSYRSKGEKLIYLLVENNHLIA